MSRPRTFRSPRGTVDILPEDQDLWRYFQSRGDETASMFGYERIDTPTFEDAELFVRGTGEVTDIVENETYTFEDRGGDLLTLRPEGTPPVCRAYLQHGMHNLPQPVRLYYAGPFFRYDRPQAGRYRQLHQFGVEVIGEADASIDAEVIELACRLLESVGVADVTLTINSIGDPKCRPVYVERLLDHYRSRSDELTHDDCRRRLDANPLRLLDCKSDACQPLIAEAPGSVESLCGACETHWRGVLGHLDALGIPYRTENRLVRGLDYYTRTVFEIAPPAGGQQSALAGGGRYDGMIEALGGRPTPGIGFAMGIERVLAYIRDSQTVARSERTKVVVAPVGDGTRPAGVVVASELRRDGVAAVLAPAGRSLRGQLRYASAVGATHAAIVGEDELARSAVVLRDLVRSEQREVPRDGLVAVLSGA